MSGAAYLTHETTAGERWDLLAHRYYGDVSRQAALIAANRALFLAEMSIPNVLPAGLVLVVPILEQRQTAASELLPPWKRG
ncbi:tail protein X [Xanthobacter sp. VTT E-85241]|uniref:tail protein X n=1 Tax=Roseixanthobacter finlandensis TaxID=3119922 RepID=UPI003728888E